MHVRPQTTFLCILGLLTAFAVGAWYIQGTHDGSRPLPFMSMKQGDGTHPDVRIVRIEEKTLYASATGSYPQFEKASNTFNKEIYDTVTRAVEAHATLSEENAKAREETGETPGEPFTLDVTYTITNHDDTYTSVLLKVSEYSGGAHGSSSLHTFTYDYAKKRRLSVTDVFKGTPDYLQKVSAITRIELQKQLATQTGDAAEVDMEFLESGTTATEENFSLFTIDVAQKTITFYFSLYQVAPYVFGEQHVTLEMPQQGSTPSWLK
ncbi:MAG: hypothetical protein RI911_51 [Candidatus Parcubacteria bacterium]|jgi:hypothetical protein